MKKPIVQTLFLLVLCGFAGADKAHAQRRVIRQPAYYEATRGLAQARSSKPRIETTVDETFRDGYVVRSVETVYERLAADRWRRLVRTVDAGAVTEQETIVIGHMRYTRENGGEWTKVDLRQQGQGSGSGSGIGGGRYCEQYTVEDSYHEGQPARLYERVAVDSNTNELTFRRERHWVGDEGLPYREELTEGKLFPAEDTRRVAVTYQYDPDKKIEAPIP